MNLETVAHKTREFVSQFLNTDTVDVDVDLFATGMVNSLFAIQLVLFVEKNFGMAVANEDLDFENFKSINAIIAFVGRKLSLSA